MAQLGAPSTTAKMACPNLKHMGSLVKSAGTRTTKAGQRRDYRCRAVGFEPHKFSVVIDVPDEPVAVRGVPPRCPVHASAATISRWGSYGALADGVRRQRYRCEPTEPAERAHYPTGVHFFTPPLPREHVHFGGSHCEDCGERLGVHRGDLVVARTQTWNLRIVAQGLFRVAFGEPYGAVGRWAWEVTGRQRTRPAKLSAA